ncbi:hypothetical protein AGOR_G00033320 [Albula goreensis]|uniref:Uncharacterized protein n=1 Tax=Albula goreensis TaxID=1534307 RepID=A0A8T3DYA5_9TELE|nr:hypothetical protein AGOR_G00033320 [Albula goreensis]
MIVHADDSPMETKGGCGKRENRNYSAGARAITRVREFAASTPRDTGCSTRQTGTEKKRSVACPRSCRLRPRVQSQEEEFGTGSTPGVGVGVATSVACRSDRSDPALSASSDSGLSSASVWTSRPPQQRGPSRQEEVELKRLLTGFGLENAAAETRRLGDRDMPGAQGMGPARVRVNGEVRPRERETDILDDEEEEEEEEDGLMPPHDLHSVDSIGTLSSSEGRGHFGGVGGGCAGALKGSQNSLLSDDFGSHTGDNHSNHHQFHSHVSVSVVTDQEDYGGRGHGADFLSRGGAGAPRFARAVQNPPTFGQGGGGYSTQTWVRQQQMVAAQQYPYMPPPPEGDLRLSPPCPPTVQETATRGHHREDEFAALTVDIDQSIDQLNQLIMDLDPTFVPVPTRSSSVKNGTGTGTGSTTNSSNGLNSRLVDSNGATLQDSRQAAVPPSDVRADRPQGLSRQGLSEFSRLHTELPPDMPHTQGVLYRTNSVGHRGQREELDGRVAAGSEMAPPTPAFPVIPPTPYVRDLSEFPLASGLGGVCRTEQESRSYMESVIHGPGVSDGGLYRPGASVTAAITCQRQTGMVRSMSTSGPLPRSDSVSSGHSWQDGGVMRHPLSRQSSLDSRQSPPGPAPLCQRPDRFGSGFDERPETGPPLPEKRRVSEGERSLGLARSVSPCLSGFSSPHSGSTTSIPFPNVLPDVPSRCLDSPSPLPDVLACKQATVKFVQDTSKFWYKPDISREQAIAVLKDKQPGSFIVRDSHSFRGAYGLAMKVATPPPSVLQQSKKGGDLSNELVRHFLIECTPKGVRLKGCPNEPYFGSLTALVCQHSITPLALPCKLIIPDTDPLEDHRESPTPTSSNSAAELLKQGAACNVWFLGSMEMESLTGHQAIQKATTVTLNMDPPPTSTVVHFKVSAQGITLTDNQRKLFFRRHYAVNTVIFCALDPQERKWMRDSSSSAKIFGFVARKSGNAMDNVCHLFAEHDPEQPASAIVNFVSKVFSALDPRQHILGESSRPLSSFLSAGL